MDEYLSKSIKEVMDKFPEVGRVLNEYNVGCVSCNVGTCLLKDIVSIHNLSSEEEKELMARLKGIFNPDAGAKKTQGRGKGQATTRKISYSNPMQKLVDEHVLIKRWLALIPQVIQNMDIESEQDRLLVARGIEFIRSYADKYHHAKEEDILFKYFDEGADILHVMHQDHKKARAHVRAMLEALDNKDKGSLAEHLMAYRALLTEHIKKEDEVLYPWMDRNLSAGQLAEMICRFGKSDKEFEESSRRNEEFVLLMEKNFKEK